MDAVSGQARDQAGVISRGQLLEAGLNGRTIHRLSKDGLLPLINRGVYAVGRAELSHKGYLWSAVLSTGEGATIANQSAVSMLDLARRPWRPVHVLVTSGNPRPQPGVCVHRTIHLPDQDVVVTDRPRCTNVARTLLDVAPATIPKAIDQLLDRSVRTGTFDYREFERVVRERPSVRGARALMDAVARLDATAGLARSELERLLIELIKNSPLPTPAVNTKIDGMEVDLAWWGARAIIEADGRQFHITPADIAADIAKQQALAALGFVVRRFDWAAVNYRPEETIAYAQAFVEANLAPPVPGPRNRQFG